MDSLQVPTTTGHVTNSTHFAPLLHYVTLHDVIQRITMSRLGVRHGGSGSAMTLSQAAAGWLCDMKKNR